MSTGMTSAVWISSNCSVPRSPDGSSSGLRAMSFRLKTILGVAIIELVMLVALIVHSLSILRDSNQRELAKRANSSATLLATGVKGAIISHDLATVDSFVEGMLENPGVRYVRVLGLDRTLSEYGDPALLTRPFVADDSVADVTDDVFDTSVAISENQFTYGRVEMGFSTSEIEATLIQTRTQIILIAVLEIVLVAFFSAMLGTYLTRRLATLEQASRVLADGELGVQVPVSGEDELARTSRAFNMMSDRLMVAREEQQASELALSRAKEQAEQANRAKSDFLATMSHELRTPLTGMLGSISLLRDRPLDNEAELYAETASNAGQALLLVINDILDYAKIEADRLELDVAEFEPGAVVDGIVNLLATSAHPAGIELGVYVACDVPRRVRGDAGRLRQILLNLLGNGVKFTPSGGVMLTVCVVDTSEGVVRLRFDVKDTGIGISEENQQKLFERFTQVDGSYSRGYGGTGLGLAISQRLVELMGGVIEVHSVVGKGSTFGFTIALPAVESAAPAPQIDTRIVLCEPNPVSCELLCRKLDDFSAAVVVTRSAEETAQVVMDGEFDAIMVADTLPDIEVLYESLRQASDVAWILVERRGAPMAIRPDIIENARTRLKKPVHKYELEWVLAQLIGPEPGVPASAAAVPLNEVSFPEALASATRDEPVTERRIRILLAEDNPINQMVTSRMLAKAHYWGDVVGNGREAVEAITRARYDVVLMDLSMPMMDGLEATRAIRHLPGDESDIPILALTANALSQERERCLAAGMTGYLTKPIDVGVLLEAVAHATASA